MSWCVEIDAGAAPAAIGGKARSLLRLAEAGLRVPAAFAVSDRLFLALRARTPPVPRALRDASDLAALDAARAALLAALAPPDFANELDRHLDRVARGGTGARFSVRSSFAREDDGGALGAGVYESVVDVERAAVAAAIRQVLASALSPGALAYARAHGDPPESAAPAVLIHGYVAGPSAGSAAFDATRDPPVAIEASAGEPTARARGDLERAVRDLAARHGPVEVEWVETTEGLIFLQLRRYVAPAAVHASAFHATAWRAQLGAGDWRWDAAHNPLPLSPAQAGLVALVDAQCRIGLRQQVAGGYLFYAPDGAAPPDTIDPDALDAALAALAADLDAGLAALGTPPALPAALDLFVATYQRIYGLIQPAARRATRALEDFLRAHVGDVSRLPALCAGVPSLADERRRRADAIARATSTDARASALAAYLTGFGDESAIWDVAAPTYIEEPERLRALAGGAAAATINASAGPAEPHARARSDASGDASRDASADASRDAVATRLTGSAREMFASLLAAARRARAAGEDDDWLYARAQAAVRRALLGEGARLVARGLLDQAGDVFWLPLDEVRAGLAGGGSRPERRARIAAAKAAHEAALRSPPGASAGADESGDAHPPVIRGQRASAGRVVGRAFVYRTALALSHRTALALSAAGGVPARGPRGDEIVVATTVLPTELPLLSAAGLVVESGGVLGHVAAQARERGIPALIGAAGATAAISDGDLILLDADAGCVVRLSEG